MADKAEATLARVLQFANAFPRPVAGQGVRADALKAALEPLRPLALRVAALPVGTAKGKLEGPGWVNAIARFSPLFLAAEAIEGGTATPATGYLSKNPTVTAEDQASAKFIIAMLTTALPAQGQAPVDAEMYNAIKIHAYRLLAVATDLDIDTAAADQVSAMWGSLKDVLVVYAQQARQAADKGLSVGMTALFIFAGGAGVWAMAQIFKR